MHDDGLLRPVSTLWRAVRRVGKLARIDFHPPLVDIELPSQAKFGGLLRQLSPAQCPPFPQPLGVSPTRSQLLSTFPVDDALFTAACGAYVSPGSGVEVRQSSTSNVSGVI